MLVKITTTKTEEKQVELRLPAYFVEPTNYSPRHIRICEDESIVDVNLCGVIIFSQENSKERTADIISKFLVSTEEKFFEMYNAALARIENSVMPLPVI